MIRSLDDLTRYAFRARDGDVGRVHDFYFDDDAWIVRYLVVDTGRWLPGRTVLIAPQAIEGIDWNERTIDLDLTKEQIEKSPELDEDEPVSRQKESELFDYYGWQPYWLATPGAMDSVAPVAPLRSRPVSGRIGEPADGGDPHLRSVREVNGYAVACTDDDAGEVHDFACEDDTWTIRYLVVDTRRWLPGRKVLVALDWIASIDWAGQRIELELTSEKMKESPEFDPTAPVNRRYEERLYDFYGRPRYWTADEEEGIR
ncbi:MAG TPA: PRC-barrel domain-containing protein [Candidatus Krumholzibacteria bacterium]|nr:PRC-barrel domain-containing protein [Candidatus Krumholzibacteria bacterium]